MLLGMNDPKRRASVLIEKLAADRPGRGESYDEEEDSSATDKEEYARMAFGEFAGALARNDQTTAMDAFKTFMSICGYEKG